MKPLVIIMAALALTACSRTPSNVHVVSTTDCGANWEKLDTGSAIPKHTGNPCGYTTAIPNWPMAGETEFKTQFAGKVLSNARMSYSYSINNPVAFVSEARYLGKMGGSLEISASEVGSKYEMAENIIIDKLLRELTTEMTRDLEIIDANPASIEDAVYKQANEALVAKGVVLSDMALVLENDDQTRLAIDSATAIRVYEAAGIRDVGKEVIAARAGATQISVINQAGAKHE